MKSFILLYMRRKTSTSDLMVKGKLSSTSWENMGMIPGLAGDGIRTEEAPGGMAHILLRNKYDCYPADFTRGL